jgi:hypothetical protein
VERVSLPATYEVDNEFDSAKFIKMRLKACHDGKNLNGSVFEVQGMAAAESSIANTPVLAHVVWKDGVPDFGGHDMHIEDDRASPGKDRLVYDETPIGVIPEACNHEIRKDGGHSYVFADCYLWRGYMNYAEDVISREKTVPLSIEVAVDAYRYDRKADAYVITDYKYTGVTLLGSGEEPAMEGACATVFAKKDVYALMEDLKEEIIRYQSGAAAPDLIQDTSPPEGGKGDEGLEKIEFQLAGEIVQGLNERLSMEGTVTTDWGTYPRYSYWDHDMDKGEVYAIDREDWNLYGFGFSFAGDAVVVDFASKKRKRLDVVDFTDGTGEQLFATMEVLKEVGEQFVQSQTAVAELREQSEGLKAQVAEMAGKLEMAERQAQELETYRAEAEKEAKHAAAAAVISEFADLEGNAEFEAVKEKAAEFAVDELRKECYAIRGKHVHVQRFTKQPLRIPLATSDENQEWALLSKYAK